MRVVGGSARGRTLKGPPRARAGATPKTRPTSDLVREALFDMLDAMSADYSRVLDLYAGTGALGIEALSRGDGTADFVEADRAAAAVIRANLELTGFAPRAGLLVGRVERAWARLRGPYTLVLADPPYYDDAAVEVIVTVAASPLLATDGVLVLEQHRRVVASEMLGPLALYRSRRHGDAVISIYRREAHS